MNLNPTLNAAATQAQQAAFNALPPTVQATINSVDADVATAAPAIALGQTIASGGVPTEAQIIGGLASVTTLTLGPFAGAAVGAIGAVVAGAEAALESFFSSLGLYDQVPSYHYKGLVRVSPVPDRVPYGPSDPYWIDVSTYAKLMNFYAHGDAHHPAISGIFDSSMLNLLEESYLQQMTAAQVAALGYPGIYVAQTPFEKYFSVLLAQDLLYWANAQGYVPPRTVLSGAVQAWNNAHSPSTQQTFGPPPSDHDAGGGNMLDSIVSLVVGPQGDSVGAATTGNVQDIPPVVVNTGAETDAAKKIVTLHLARTAPPVTGALSTTAKVALSTAIVGGSTAAGVAVWAHVTRQGYGQAWSRLWGKSGGRLLKR